MKPPVPTGIPAFRGIDNLRATGLCSFMALEAKIALVAGLFSLSFMLNLPMGMFRKHTESFALKIFFIHAAIPVIYFGRMFSGLDWRYIPVFIGAAVLGQVWGGRMGL
jgi:hypothetical protein